MVPMHYLRALAWDVSKRIARSEEGATAVEYGIMVAAIAAVIILVVLAIGTKVNVAFQKVNTAMPAS